MWQVHYGRSRHQVWVPKLKLGKTDVGIDPYAGNIEAILTSIRAHALDAPLVHLSPQHITGRLMLNKTKPSRPAIRSPVLLEQPHCAPVRLNMSLQHLAGIPG